MARPKCERKKTNISIDPALYDDVLKLVEGGDYRNVSHFFDMAGRKLANEKLADMKKAHRKTKIP